MLGATPLYLQINGAIMKNLKILLSLSIALSFLSCKSPTEPLEGNNNQNKFFPMNIGNKWYYNSYNINDGNFDTTKYDETWEIKNKVSLDNKIFYLFEDIFYSDSETIKSVDTIYYSIKNDSLFQIEDGKILTKSSIDFLGLFSDKPYSNFIVRKDPSGNYMGEVFKSTDTTFTFYYYQDGWADSGWQMTFQKGIGYIESHSGWGLGKKLVKYSLK